MILLAILGGCLVAAGLAGLGYCIWQGFRIRGRGATGAEANAAFHRLVPINLASVAAAALGLMVLTAYFVIR